MGKQTKNLFGTFFVIITALVTLTGCGDYQAKPHDQDYDYTPTAAAPVISRSGGSDAPTAASDPQVTPDPMLSGGDPNLKDSPDTAHDPSVSQNDPQAAGGDTKNWYWLRGTISNGEMEITVNGVQIGRYSVTMDKEITKYVRAGMNTIEFTSISSGVTAVVAHLSVVASEQGQGSTHALTYDTSAPTASPAPVDSEPAGAQSIPKFDPFGPSTAPGSPIASQTDTETFTAV